MIKDKHIGNGTLPDSEYADLQHNILTTIRYIEKGYRKEEPRRTGEPYHIHPLRIFLRGVNLINAIGDTSRLSENERSSIYISLLSRILHDENEDGRNLNIQHTSLENVHEISAPIIGGSFLLKMTDKQKILLQNEVNALSFPDFLKGKTKNGNGTNQQIARLLNMAEELYIRNGAQGALDAYLTLRTKIDDRIDNILTYFEGSTKTKVSTNVKLHKKISETIHYFTVVEQIAQQYLEKYCLTNPMLAESLQSTSESAVGLCESLLSAGGYDALFEGQLLVESKRLTSDQRKSLVPEFLIPQYNAR